MKHADAGGSVDDNGYVHDDFVIADRYDNLLVTSDSISNLALHSDTTMETPKRTSKKKREESPPASPTPSPSKRRRLGNQKHIDSDEEIVQNEDSDDAAIVFGVVDPIGSTPEAQAAAHPIQFFDM